MTNADIPLRNIQATLHVQRGKITAVGGCFFELTGYSDRDVLGREISHVLKVFLRLPSASYEALTAGEEVSAYIFTATDEARQVTASAISCSDGSVRYALEELPDSRFADRISILDSLFLDDFMSVALYSVPDYTVLKANERFMDFYRQACCVTGSVLGQSVCDQTPGCLVLKDMLDNAVKTRKVTHFVGVRFVGAGERESYRNYSFQTICSSNQVKFIVETSFDVTEFIRAQMLQEKHITEIKLQKEKLETVIEDLSDPLVIFDSQGNYETLNKAAREVFGRGAPLNKVGDINSAGVYSDFSDNIMPFEGTPGYRILHGEKLRHFELKTLSTEEPHYFDVSGTPIYDDEDNFVCGVIYNRDVTAHFRHQKELSENNKLLSAVIENMHDAMVIYDGEGNITFLNAKAREMYPDFNEKTTVMTVHEGAAWFDLSGREIATENLPSRRAMRGETIQNECIVIIRRNWTKVIEVNGTPIFDEEGKLLSAVVTYHDMTELLQNQRLMQTKDDLLREKNKVLARQAKMLDLSNEAIFAWETSGKIVYWNKGAEMMYGFTEMEAVGQYAAQLLETAYLDRAAEIPAQFDETDEWRGSLEHTTKTGSKIIVESRLQVIRDESGEKLVLETNRDITERKKMMDALQESEKNYRLASVGSGAGVYAYDFLQDNGYWSTRYKEILGLPPDAVLAGDTEYAFTGVHPEDKDKLVAMLDATFDPDGGGILECTYRIVRPDGAVRWVHARGQTFFAGQGDGVHPYLTAGAIVDITDEKATGDQIKRLSEELTQIIESTDDYVFSVDRDYKIIFCNTAARRHFKDFYGQEINDIVSVADLIPMRLAASFRKQAHKAWLSGGAHFEFRTPIGERIVSYSVNPVNIGGELVEVTVFGKDITERSKTEHEIIRLNASLEERVAERTAQLQQSVRDLENFALILSHDVKSALRGIGMYADNILDGKNTDENAQKIRTANRELLAMVDGLMKYEKSSRSAIVKEDINLKKMIVAIFNELNAVTESQGLLEFETGLPNVMADREALRHAVLNIMSNALKFAMPGRPPRIDVGCRAEDDFYIVYFKDNGIGFEKAYAEKIFGVFERLHGRGEYEGSGVGLAIVRNIIQRHGGRVWADSEPDGGTTVYIAMPMCEDEEESCIK